MATAVQNCKLHFHGKEASLEKFRKPSRDSKFWTLFLGFLAKNSRHVLPKLRSTFYLSIGRVLIRYFCKVHLKFRKDSLTLNRTFCALFPPFFDIEVKTVLRVSVGTRWGLFLIKDLKLPWIFFKLDRKKFGPSTRKLYHYSQTAFNIHSEEWFEEKILLNVTLFYMIGFAFMILSCFFELLSKCFSELLSKPHLYVSRGNYLTSLWLPELCGFFLRFLNKNLSEVSTMRFHHCSQKSIQTCSEEQLEKKVFFTSFCNFFPILSNFFSEILADLRTQHCQNRSLSFREKPLGNIFLWKTL